MQEGYVEAFGAFAGGFVDESYSFALYFGECVCYSVGNCKCEVVYAFASFFYEFGYGAIFAGGFEQLYFGLPYFEECCFYFLVGYFFDSVAFETQDVFIVRNGLFETFYGYSQMFNVRNFHCDMY